MKIESFAVQAVFSRHVSVGARNLEMQERKSEHAFVQLEGALQVRRYQRCTLILRRRSLAQTAHTQGIDPPLKLLVGEVALGNVEAARESQPICDVGRSRGK